MSRRGEDVRTTDYADFTDYTVKRICLEEMGWKDGNLESSRCIIENAVQECYTYNICKSLPERLGTISHQKDVTRFVSG